MWWPFCGKLDAKKELIAIAKNLAVLRAGHMTGFHKGPRYVDGYLSGTASAFHSIIERMKILYGQKEVDRLIKELKADPNTWLNPKNKLV